MNHSDPEHPTPDDASSSEPPSSEFSTPDTPASETPEPPSSEFSAPDTPAPEVPEEHQFQPLGRSRLLKSPKTWFLLVVAIALSVVGGQTWSASRTFNRGETAYHAGDCNTALTQFNRLLASNIPMDMDDWADRALARTEECQRYQTAVDASTRDTPATALLAAHEFLDRYPASAVASQLRQTITDQTSSTFSTDLATKLATVEVCDRLEPITTQQLWSNPDTQYPLMLQACGHTYSEAQNFDSAISLYTTFVDQYPDHDQMNAVEVAMAQTMIDQANTENPGEIPPPPLSGYTGDESTVVIIRNDSPEAMRIVLSGTDPQFQDLAPCEDSTKD
ncbi:MAG: hypothetical protein F6K09_32450 [Merismopedia sp. SIO2A8]|nr:hypothetical protein [Merismopedia sp. SIO2A8]